MSQFLLQMSIQVITENFRKNLGWLLDEPDIDPRRFVLATRPFKKSHPGQLWDVRKARSVPCPHRDQLIDALAAILTDYAKLYIHRIDRQRFNERYQVRKALETLRTFLERQGAPRRHKKI